MSRIRNAARGTKETVKTYPASTTSPFIALALAHAVNQGWLNADQALLIGAAWPAVVTFFKQKVAPRIFGDD